MKKRDFLKAGAAATALALPAAASAQGATYSWKMATAWPGGPLMDIGA
jgi:TRAP-type mannitol/chloroaromatic compound transport system substrate-binding protein